MENKIGKQYKLRIKKKNKKKKKKKTSTKKKKKGNKGNLNKLIIGVG